MLVCSLVSTKGKKASQILKRRGSGMVEEVSLERSNFRFKWKMMLERMYVSDAEDTPNLHNIFILHDSQSTFPLAASSYPDKLEWMALIDHYINILLQQHREKLARTAKFALTLQPSDCWVVGKKRGKASLRQEIWNKTQLHKITTPPSFLLPSHLSNLLPSQPYPWPNLHFSPDFSSSVWLKVSLVFFFFFCHLLEQLLEV